VAHKLPIKGVHRVRKKLADGTVREYHYAYRGGPQFWSSVADSRPGDRDYVFALNDSLRPSMPEKPKVDRGLTVAVMARYRNSPQYLNLKPRTKQDYDKFLGAFEEEFGNDRTKLFEERESLAEINDWKNRWAHSLKQWDYATTVVTRFLNWARKHGVSIVVHYHNGIERMYRANRADFVWLPQEIAALLAVASERERRIVVAASEGGLTPQDIGRLTPDHVQRTPLGRRLFFRRAKSDNPVSIPVTPALAELIDTTPKAQKRLIVSLDGRPLTPERASQIVRDVKARANDAAKADPTRIHIRDELRLYDMRGTAATELLRAGCSLNEIAVTMGWGLRHAANIIERYAALVPEVADEVLEKLVRARRKVRAGEQGQ